MLFLLRLRSNRLQKGIAFEAGLDPSYLAAMENGRRFAVVANLPLPLTHTFASKRDPAGNHRGEFFEARSQQE